MPFLTPLAILLGFLALAGALAWSRPRPAAPQAAPEPAPGPAPDDLRDVHHSIQNLLSVVHGLVTDLERMKIRVEGLPGLWKEEADRANRAAEREEKASRRRRARGEEVEAGAGDDFAGADAQAGGEQPVHPMRPHLASVNNDETLIAQARRAIAIHELSGGGRR